MRNFPFVLAVAVLYSGRLYAQCGPIGDDPLADKTCWLNNGTPSITIKPGAQIGGTLWPTLIQAQSFFAGYSEIPPNSLLWITSGTDNHDPSDSGCGHFEGCKVDFRIATQNNTTADSVSKFIIKNPGTSFVRCRSTDNAPEWISTLGVSGGSIFAMELSTPPYPSCPPYQGRATGPHWDFLTSLEQITTPWDNTQGLSVEVGQTTPVSAVAYGMQNGVQFAIPMQPGMFEYVAPGNGAFGAQFADIDVAGNVTGVDVGSFYLYVTAGSDCDLGEVIPNCVGIFDPVVVSITANQPPDGGTICPTVGPPGGCWKWDPTNGGWDWFPGGPGQGGGQPPGNAPSPGACPASSGGVCWEWDPTANGGNGAWILVTQPCQSCPPTTTSPPISTAQSKDPNAISGPTGTGPAQYISGVGPTGYAIFFENEPTATAAADQVVVTNVVDPTRFDLTTLTLGPITFPGYPGVIPPAIPLETAGQFSTQVTLTSSNLLVNVIASLNPTTGLLTWILQTIDPTTGLPPSDPSLGLLPPGQGGSLTFTAKLLRSLTNGSVINDQATVTFDANAPISTAVWSNTLDTTPPTSHVNALPSTESTASFMVSWSGTDIVSGIQNYTIYVSDSGGPYGAWLTQTTTTSAKFIGTNGHTYSFYSIAIDNAGNVEPAKTVPEASTEVTEPTQVTPTVMVVPSSTSITTAQPLAATVTVSGGTGNPIPTGSVSMTSGSYSSAATTLTSGSATINIPAGSLATGSDTLTASYTPDSSSSSTYNTATGTSGAVTVTQATQTITFANPGTQTVGTPLTLSATATSGLAVTFTSTTTGVCTVSGTTASFIISGTCTIDANQAGNSAYAAAPMVPQTFTVSQPVPTTFTVAGTAVTVNPGATTANTSTVTLTPAGGFTGSVALTAAVTSSPAGAQYPPSLSFGYTSPVSITGASAGTATLTISTTAATSSALSYPKRPGVPWYAAGGATLACLLLLGIPAQRRSWRTILGMLMFLAALTAGVVACGGGGNGGGGGGGGGGGIAGTTAGTYTITVTGTSGSTTATGIVALTVQ